MPALSVAKRCIVSDYVRNTLSVIETGVKTVESWAFSGDFGIKANIYKGDTAYHYCIQSSDTKVN